MPDQQAAPRPQAHYACGRCGFPIILLIPGVYAHATTAGGAACAIARSMARFSAAGWNLDASAAMNDTQRKDT